MNRQKLQRTRARVIGITDQLRKKDFSLQVVIELLTELGDDLLAEREKINSELQRSQ